MRFYPVKKLIVFILVISTIGSWSIPLTAQDDPTSEYEIKAAFIFNFAKFIEWPARIMNETNGSFIIGILGKDPFGNSLEQTIGGKTIKGKKISIRRFRQPDEIQTCHILFISESERYNLPVILDAIKDKSILTVSDMPVFAQRGGMIHMYTEDNRVRFAVYMPALERAGLNVSAKLLSLAKVLSE
jgi:hypothetical protein